MSEFIYPSLYQVNTRVMIRELSLKKGNAATLDDIPDNWLDELASGGFDWIWFLSVWQTGQEGQRISRQNAGWRKEFEETLADLNEEDIGGSGFAIKRYRISEDIGGDEALSRLRKRLTERGLKLMLDFVPNHTSPDNDWVKEHIDFYIRGNEADIEREPQNYTRINNGDEDLILAHGRDPFFPGWPDTLQLNYGNSGLVEAMTEELLRISGQCDGVRCDMAMLILPEVFAKTWGSRSLGFWPEAIRRVREINSGFCLMAEVYWDLEWTMLQQGFNYAYDKRLYDRLKEGQAKPVREHLNAGIDYQSKMARFLENHDEPRAAVDFPGGKHEAAAILTFLSPGLRFFHQGQFEGRTKRISPHLIRAPHEPLNEKLKKFYERLLDILRQPVFRTGKWQLLECLQAWESNWTHGSYICYFWHGNDDKRIIVSVNYSPSRSQCFIRLPFDELASGAWKLKNLINGDEYERNGVELQEKGLYMDEPGWKIYVFSLLRN